MEGQPSLGIHPLALGLGVVPVDLLEFSQQVLNLCGKPVLYLHEPAPGMGQAVGQDRVQLPGLTHGVGGEGIAHLDGSRQSLRPVLQNGFQILPGVVVAGDEQGDPVVPGAREDGAGVDRLASLPRNRSLLQDPHDSVVVEQHLALGGLARELRMGRGEEPGRLEQNLPLRRDRQRDPHPGLEPLDAVHGKAGPVTQQTQEGGHAAVVLLLAHTRGCRGGEHLAAEVAPPPLELVDGGHERRHARDPQQGGRLLLGVDLAIGAMRATLTGGYAPQRNRNPPGLGKVGRSVAPMALRLLALLLGAELEGRVLGFHGLTADGGERLGLRAPDDGRQALDAGVLPVQFLADDEHGFDQHPHVLMDLALAHGLPDAGHITAQHFR